MNTLSTTYKHIRRSPYQSLAAILTMFLTLLLAGFFCIATIASVVILHHFEGKPQITVFFTDTADTKQVGAVQKTLVDTQKTAAVKYVSKDDALALYREQNKNDPLLLEMVTADILPASLEITAIDPKYLQELAPILQKAEGVEEVIYQKDVVDTLITWTNAIRLVGGILAGLLAIDSILIVMTVISMKIALKKEEIEILKLIGASSFSIRLPFIVEGGIYGMIGAVSAWVVLTAIVLWQREFLLAFLGVIPIIKTLLASPADTLFLVSDAAFLGVLVCVGLLLGSVGSLVSVGRYLKF